MYSLQYIFFFLALLTFGSHVNITGTESNPYSLDALAVFMFRVIQRVNHPVCSCILFTICLQLYHPTFTTTLSFLTSYCFFHTLSGESGQGIFECRLCDIDVLPPLWGKGITYAQLFSDQIHDWISHLFELSFVFSEPQRIWRWIDWALWLRRQDTTVEIRQVHIFYSTWEITNFISIWLLNQLIYFSPHITGVLYLSLLNRFLRRALTCSSSTVEGMGGG